MSDYLFEVFFALAALVLFSLLIFVPNWQEGKRLRRGVVRFSGWFGSASMKSLEGLLVSFGSVAKNITEGYFPRTKYDTDENRYGMLFEFHPRMSWKQVAFAFEGTDYRLATARELLAFALRRPDLLMLDKYLVALGQIVSAGGFDLALCLWGAEDYKTQATTGNYGDNSAEGCLFLAIKKVP